MLNLARDAKVKPISAQLTSSAATSRPTHLKSAFFLLLRRLLQKPTLRRIRILLNHMDEAKKMGENGKEHVRKNFLIVSDLKDFLQMCVDLEKTEIQKTETQSGSATQNIEVAQKNLDSGDPIP